MRKPTIKEIEVIMYLADKAKLRLDIGWDDQLMVEPMNDGGMGSLLLFPNDESKNVERQFGSEVAKYHFEDKDGQLVISSLYLDEQNNLYELDMWKPDGGPFISFPEEFDYSKEVV